MSQIKVKQIRGLSRQTEVTRKTIQALGLKGIGSEKLHKDNNCIRGMVNKVKHLIRYELIG